MDGGEPAYHSPLSHFQWNREILKIHKRIKVFLGKYFFFLGLILFFILSGSLVFVSGKKIKSLSSRNPSLRAVPERSFYEDSFISSAKNFLADSPEMNFIQNDTLVNISSPVIITPHILASILSNEGAGNEIMKYKVEPGDTLSAIAAKFDISLQTVLWANNLNSRSIITPGQELIILPVSGVLYTVRKNDTLGAIAKRYKADVEKIIAFNGLSEEADIYIGDSLIIPDGKMSAKISRIALIPVAESYFIFPCQGIITQGLHYYNAIDIANKCGSPIVAASSGIVQRTGWIRLGGKRVTILHPNGVVTYYGHFSKILVSSGQKVDTGDIIGYMGRTGNATGCHLHFEVIGAKNFLAKYPVGTRISWKR